MSENITQPTMSLLWPEGVPDAHHPPNRETLLTDLNLPPLIQELSLTYGYEKFVRDTLLNFTTDTDVIAYRQAVMADLLRVPELVGNLEAILDNLVDLRNTMLSPQWQDNQLQKVAWRLSELENYVSTVARLDDILTTMGDQVQSEALRRLREIIRALSTDPTFQMLRDELPIMVKQLRSIKSVTVGINLDDEMRPLSVMLVSANVRRFANDSLLERLFNRSSDEVINGIGPLHDARKVNFGGARFEIELRDRNSPFMPVLFRDLSNLLDKTAEPVVQALRKYTRINSRFLLSLRMEIAFYLGGVRLVRTLQEAGVAMCQPEIAPAAERVGLLKGLVNVNLALQMRRRHADLRGQIVPNDALFGDEGRIFILTGPNQGGKTTYARAVGLAQVLFQAGLHVPAEQARLSPVEGIYTHFATEERPDLETGRLGEEARRLGEIFDHATRHSLILLNESLASTSAVEGVFLARDLVRVLRVMGARAIFATHLHDLAAACAEMNAETEGDSRIISLVSRVQLEDDGDTVKRTYQIVPAPPLNKSYAVELAARYGISFAQLTEKLRRRRALPPE